MNEKVLTRIIVGLMGLLLLLAIGQKVLVEKTSERVIQKLRRDYSPSPYGPGIDPDVLDPQKIRFNSEKDR